jgi:hypothetical protein
LLYPPLNPKEKAFTKPKGAPRKARLNRRQWVRTLSALACQVRCDKGRITILGLNGRFHADDFSAGDVG